MQHLRFSFRARNLLATALLMAGAGQAFAVVSATGDVTPNPLVSTPADRLYIADEEDGQMHINGGSLVESYRGYIGYDWDTTGVVTVSGTGSHWDIVDYLYVGFQGTASLTISNGGQVSNHFSLVGTNSRGNGSVMVTGPSSSWTNTGNIYFGFNFNTEGTLTIDHGATVTNQQGMLGDSSSTTGWAYVRNGSTWNNANLIVGFDGEGHLDVSGGSTVTCDSLLMASSRSGSVGHATVMGPGTNITCTERVHVGWVGTASMTIGDGATVTAPDQARVAGSTDSIGTLTFLLTENGPGKLSTDGNLYLTPIGSFAGESTANFVFETDGSHSFASGDMFDLIDWGGTITGSWDSVTLPALPQGLAWDTEQLEIDGSISVIDLVLGDLNGDGALTNGDINPFVQALVDPATFIDAYPHLDPAIFADFNGDGQFTNGDINGFVTALTGAANVAPVPEPASMALLVFGGVLIARRRR